MRKRAVLRVVLAVAVGAILAYGGYSLHYVSRERTVKVYQPSLRIDTVHNILPVTGADNRQAPVCDRNLQRSHPSKGGDCMEWDSA